MKRHKFILLLILFTFGVLIPSCSDQSENKVAVENANSEKPKTEVHSLIFTPEETAYIEKLRKRGGLHIAIEKARTVYEPKDDGSIDGMHYKLAQLLAKQLDLPLKIKIITFKDYFSINGEIPERVMSDPSYSYTPDLLNQVDLYVHTITVLPWRAKLVSYVEILPTKMVLLCRKGEQVNSLHELKNKRIATLRSLSYYTRFKEIEAQLDTRFNFVLITDRTALAKTISEKKADVTALDSNRAILRLKEYPDLDVGMPLTDVQKLGWALHKENHLLDSILTKFIDYTKNQGIFDQLWMEQYGIPHTDYLKLIDYQKEVRR